MQPAVPCSSQLSSLGPGCPHAVARCPHYPRGNQHREAHQQEGEAAAAKERQGERSPWGGGASRAEPELMCISLTRRCSETPTVTAAGTTGRCFWAWTCPGKAPGKPLCGKVVAQRRVGVSGTAPGPLPAPFHPPLRAGGLSRHPRDTGSRSSLLPTALAPLPSAETSAFSLHRHWLTRVLLPSPHLPHGTGLSWELPPCVREPLLAI